MVVIVTPETDQYCSPIIRRTSKPSPISMTSSSKSNRIGVKYSETANYKSAPPNSNAINNFLLTRLLSLSHLFPYPIGTRQAKAHPTSRDRHESSKSNPNRPREYGRLGAGFRSDRYKETQYLSETLYVITKHNQDCSISFCIYCVLR